MNRGVTSFHKLCRHVEPDPALDREAFEDCLEEIHKQAFPEAHGRPPRLTGAPIPDPRVSDPRE